MRGNGQEDDLVEAWVVSNDLLRVDASGVGRESCGLPLLLGGLAVGGQHSLAAASAHHGFSRPASGPLAVTSEAENVIVNVDLHG